MNTSRKIATLMAGMALFAGAGAASGAEQLIIRLDHSQIMAMPRTPATVIVGNPSIADVTIEGKNVFLHGHAFGTSNVIVLDEEGKQLADYEVTVQNGGGNNVFVYKAGFSSSFVCAPDCEATLHIGDDEAFFSEVVAKQQKLRNGIALGQKDGEAKAAPESQQPQ